MNVIAWLEYELTYYDSAVHHFNPYTTGTPPWQEEVRLLLYSQDDINNNNNTGGRFWYEQVYFLLSWWHEERDTISKGPMLIILCWQPLPPRATHLVVSEITHICRSRPKLICSDQIRKTQPPASTVVPQLPSFWNPKILRMSLSSMTSSTHSIHFNGTSSPFPVWEFRVPCLTTTPESRDTEWFKALSN